MRAGEVTSKTIHMSYNREPNWQKLKPEIDWDEMEEKLADKLEGYINQNKIKQTVMNQGIVKSQKFVRTWNGPSGDIHYFDLVVESNNGLNEVGQIGVKDMNSPKIQVGATLHYTTEERTGPTGRKSTNFKLQNPMQYSGSSSVPSGAGNSAVNYRKESPDVQNSISKSVALNNAVLFCKEQKGSKPGDVLDTAEIFLAWLKGESIVETKLAITNEISNDEMPF
tara:strand:- start:1551 stop:2222 length:672 start_codon:yes stop_codon:yes gene_type:complete